MSHIGSAQKYLLVGLVVAFPVGVLCSAKNRPSCRRNQVSLGGGASYARVASCMSMNMIRALSNLLTVSFDLLLGTVRFPSLSLRCSAALRAENLFLRRQLALYAERKVRARRANDGARLAPVLLSGFFAWKDALVIVRLETVVCRHRKSCHLFWRWKSGRRGRPAPVLDGLHHEYRLAKVAA